MTGQEIQTTPKSSKEDFTKTVGLISDTHIPARAKNLPKEVFRVFEDVELIVHAGDLVDLSVIVELEQIAPVLAVHGNMDTPEIRVRLPEMTSFKLFDWQIGVIHDSSALFGVKKMREIALGRINSTCWSMVTRIMPTQDGTMALCL
jgi:putative phosphoesterase